MAVNRNKASAIPVPNFQANEIVTVTIANGGTDSTAFDMRGFTGGIVILPGAITGTALSFKVSDAEGGAYVPLRKSDDTAVEALVVGASRAFALPVGLKGAAWVKLVMDAQGAARSIKVCLSA